MKNIPDCGATTPTMGSDDVAVREAAKKDKNAQRWRKWHDTHKDTYNAKRRAAARIKAADRKKARETKPQQHGTAPNQVATHFAQTMPVSAARPIPVQAMPTAAAAASAAVAASAVPVSVSHFPPLTSLLAAISLPPQQQPFHYSALPAFPPPQGFTIAHPHFLMHQQHMLHAQPMIDLRLQQQQQHLSTAAAISSGGGPRFFEFRRL